MKRVLQILGFFLFMGAAAAGLFEVQKLNLPKVYTSAIATLFCMTLILVIRPFIEKISHGKEDEPKPKLS